MRRAAWLTLALLLAGGVEAPTLAAASLRGSPAAMQQQYQVARQHGLSFFRTPADIRRAVEEGELVRLTGSPHYEVADFVRFPYAHEGVRVFVERLAEQYHEACGQRLVVTSAVRPLSLQPWNAHQLSVHPAGMAVDLRVSDRASCRSHLEGTILSLERQGLLNGIREFRPPHYHVAVFPGPYLGYVEERLATEARERAREHLSFQRARLERNGLLAEVVAGFRAEAAPEAEVVEDTAAGRELARLAVLLVPVVAGLRLLVRTFGG